MSIECFDSGKELAVVAAGDENLGARAYGCLKDGQGASGELMLFYLSDLILGQLVARLRNELLNLRVDHGGIRWQVLSRRQAKRENVQ